MYSFGLFGNGVLFVVGIIWCQAMFRRWRSDLDELRTSREVSDWIVIGGLWGATALVLYGLIDTSVGVVRALASL